MHDNIDNPLVPARMEILVFWGLTIAFFVGWTLFAFYVGYMAGGG